MVEKENEEFKKKVKKAMAEIIKEERFMPTSAPVTEITIRVGSSEAVQVLGGGRPIGCPPEPCIEGALKPSVAEDTRARLEAFAQKKGVPVDDLIVQLDSEGRGRLVAEELKKREKNG
jgi:hypothetical protein